MSKPQVINTSSGEKMVVLTEEDYEDLMDSIAALKVKLDIAEGRSEFLSLEETKKALSAPTLLAFWRTKRGLELSKVAAAADIGEDELTAFEVGERSPDKHTLQKLCDALGIRPYYIGE